MYEIIMSDGNCAEAGTLSGAMLAAQTMYEDVGGGTFVRKIRIDGRRSGADVMATLWACRQHIKECGVAALLCSICNRPWQDHYKPDDLKFKNGPFGTYGLKDGDHTPHLPGVHAPREATA